MHGFSLAPIRRLGDKGGERERDARVELPKQMTKKVCPGLCDIAFVAGGDVTQPMATF